MSFDFNILVALSTCGDSGEFQNNSTAEVMFSELCGYSCFLLMFVVIKM